MATTICNGPSSLLPLLLTPTPPWPPRPYTSKTLETSKPHTSDWSSVLCSQEQDCLVPTTCGAPEGLASLIIFTFQGLPQLGHSWSTLNSTPARQIPERVEYACNPGTQGAEAGGTEISGHSQLHRELEASLSYMKHHL